MTIAWTQMNIYIKSIVIITTFAFLLGVGWMWAERNVAQAKEELPTSFDWDAVIPERIETQVSKAIGKGPHANVKYYYSGFVPSENCGLITLIHPVYKGATSVPCYVYVDTILTFTYREWVSTQSMPYNTVNFYAKSRYRVVEITKQSIVLELQEVFGVRVEN